MKCILLGAVGSTELAARRIAAAQGWSLELVVTLPPEASGRHSDFVDLDHVAQEAGAQILHTKNANAPDCLAAMRDVDADFIFVIGWSQICGPEFMQLTPDRIIGYHPAALPRLRGRAPLAWTILLDEKITAGSLFWLGKGADDGDLIDQHYFHVASDETARTLYDGHQMALHIMLDRTLAKLASGYLPRQPQDERYATWATKRTAADGLIDWHRPAADIERLVRAVGEPYPGAFSYSGKDKVTIWQASLIDGEKLYHAGTGQIVLHHDSGFVVKTADHLLKVDSWESESGKKPPLHSYLRDIP